MAVTSAVSYFNAGVAVATDELRRNNQQSAGY